MKNKWDKIFNNKKFSYYRLSKKIDLNENPQRLSYRLASIIYPNLTYKKFTNIISFINNNLKIVNRSSILDFGSGNGAFIFYFINKFFLKKNLSLEISQPLLKFQKSFIFNTKFVKTHKAKINYLKYLKDKTFDYSYCNSVFQYFVSDKYAKSVLHFLIRVTKKRIIIYDIKNFYKKKQYQETVIKRQNLSIGEYKKKYKDTPIKFYKKSFFIKTLRSFKNRYDFNFKFKALPSGAIDSKFGYCLIISKKN